MYPKYVHFLWLFIEFYGLKRAINKQNSVNQPCYLIAIVLSGEMVEKLLGILIFSFGLFKAARNQQMSRVQGGE